MTQAPKERRKQDRSRVTEGKVLEAADALMRDVGYEATHVSKIMKMSGVSSGAFYHHFGSKDAVIARLVQHFHSQACAQLEALDLSGKSFEQKIHIFINEMIAHFRVNHGMYRAMVENINTNPDLWAPLRDFRARYENRMLHELETDLRDRGCADPAMRIQITMQTMLGLLTHAVVIGTGPLDVNRTDHAQPIHQIAFALITLS